MAELQQKAYLYTGTGKTSVIASNKVKEFFTEQCAKREKYILDYVPRDKWGEALEEVNKECDPTYPQRKAAEDQKSKECADTLDLLINQMQQVKNDNTAFDRVVIKLLVKNKESCPVNSEQRKRLDTMKAEMDASSERIKVLAAIALAERYDGDAKRELAAGHYDAAYEAAKKARETGETLETKQLGKPEKGTATGLMNESWYALFAHKFSEALRASERALAIFPQNPRTAINHAHALMLMDRSDEAKTVYLAHRGNERSDEVWREVIEGDFDKLRKAGITHPLMVEIEAAFAPPAPVVETAPPASSPPVAKAAPPPAREEPPAPSSPPATTQPYRTPTKFSCANATLGVDFVVCDSPQLMDAMAQLEDAYAAARAAKGDAIKAAQRDWSLQFGLDCGLPKKGRPSSQTAYNAQACVFRALNARIEYLRGITNGIAL